MLPIVTGKGEKKETHKNNFPDTMLKAGGRQGAKPLRKSRFDYS